MILDPVGVKAGMDYYNNNLAYGISNNGSNKVFIASNYNVPNGGVKCFDTVSNTSNFGKLKNLLSGTLKGIKFAKKNKVGTIIFHSFSFEIKDFLLVMLIKISGFKIYTIAHDISGFAKNDSTKIRSLIFNKLSDRIIAQNQFSLSKIKEILNPEHHEKLSLIPHGHFMNLPDSSIDYNNARQKLNIPAEKKIILFFGQIKKVKGLDVLIKALKYCNSDINLYIAGKPWKDDFNTYQLIIDNDNLQSRIIPQIGYIEDSQREILFKAADVIVIPYREIYQSGVLLMAMSYNKPVIASDLPANKEIVSHLKNGLLFQSENEKDLAEKINTIFQMLDNDEQQLKSLLESARENLDKNYSWDLIGSRYQKLLQA